MINVFVCQLFVIKKLNTNHPESIQPRIFLEKVGAAQDAITKATAGDAICHRSKFMRFDIY